MCDYSTPVQIDLAEIMPGSSGPTTHNEYCKRASQFWVQSLTSTHNMHACAHHLVRIVREIEKCAQQYDVLHPDFIGDARNPLYIRPPRKITANGKSWTASESLTRDSANYARVTVKPYISKGY
jgi:hypothetical protein